MRISLIGPVYPYRGGIAHFTTLLGKKLIEAGHDVQVVSFKKQYPAWLYPGESDKDFSPGREQVDAAYLLNPLNVFSWRKTTKTIINHRPQQVVFSWWVTFWGPAYHMLVRHLNRRHIPVTFLIHNTMPHEARFYDRYLARKTLQGGDRFVVMTEKEKGRLLGLIPGAQNIQIAPLPIYRSFPATGLAKPDLRKSMGLPEDQPVILFFGLIRPYKGLGVLIDAMKILVERGVKAHLLIAGEFWEDKSKYETQIRVLGLEKLIHFSDGYIPDDRVAAYFEVSDLFVAPYIDGTQSAALKTALGFGLPVVATDVIRDETVEKYADRCKVVPAADEQALAEGLIGMLQDSTAVRADTDQLFSESWDRMVSCVVGNPENR